MAIGGASAQPVDQETWAKYREYRFRRLVPMSHEQYLDEPVGVVEWTLQFAGMDAEIEAEEINAAANKKKR